MTEIKDSGSRTAFVTGSQRDTQKGKPAPSLVPTSVIMKLALHYGKGAAKYELRNWELGQPISQYIDSAERHLMKWKLGMTDEDHLSSCLWNIVCLDWTLDAIHLGELPQELDDRPWHMKPGNQLGETISKMLEESIQKHNQSPAIVNNDSKSY